MNQLIISFVCPDKPGLVDLLSQTINSHEGNWQTSSLHHLAGYFAGVVQVSVSDEQSKKLTAALEALSQFTFTIVSSENNTKDKANLTLQVTANDRPGIIQELSSVVHHHNGNLLKLVSFTESAPHTGQEMFNAELKLDIDINSIDELVESIEQLANDIMVDIQR